jgi:hypothetical protein
MLLDVILHALRRADCLHPEGVHEVNASRRTRTISASGRRVSPRMVRDPVTPPRDDREAKEQKIAWNILRKWRQTLLKASSQAKKRDRDVGLR